MVKYFSIVSFMLMSSYVNSSQVDQLRTDLNILMSDFKDHSLNMEAVTVPAGYTYVPGTIPEFPFGSPAL